MKIKQLVQGQERRIKSVIYNDDKNSILVAYNGFDNIKNKYEEVVTVYQARTQEESAIYDLLQEVVQTQEQKLEDIKDEKLIYQLLKLLTDIEFLDDEEKNLECIKQMMDNPIPLMNEVNIQVMSVVYPLFARLYNQLVDYAKYPEDVRKALFLNKGAKEEDEKAKKKAELERQLKELE